MKVPGKSFFFLGGGVPKPAALCLGFAPLGFKASWGGTALRVPATTTVALGTSAGYQLASSEPWLVLVPPELGWVQDITLVPSSFDAFSQKKHIPCSTAMGWSTTRTLHGARGGGCRKEEGMEAGEGAGGNI